MAFIDQITLPLFILWIIGLILSFFRRDLDFLWKAFFLLIFMFYVIQFHEELFAGYYRFKYNYAKEIVNWIGDDLQSNGDFAQVACCAVVNAD